jgi:hypothetical protein
MNMGMKELAEGIILQSIEDLSDPHLREDCINFFKGNDFILCAEMAAMGQADQLKLLTMVKDTVACQAKSIRAVPQASGKCGRKQRELQPASRPFH